MRLPRRLQSEFVSAPPDRVFAYSNLGYSLAGAAVARKVGGPKADFADFENYVQANLFRPLGMRRSGFARDETVRGYVDFAAVPRPRLRDLAAGGLRSSAADLGRFTIMLINEGRHPAGAAPVLARESVHEMLRAQNAGNALDGAFRIGAGLFLDWREFPGEILAGHGGDLPPFHGAVLFSPARELGAVALTNSSSSSADMQRIAAEFLRETARARQGFSPPGRRGFRRPPTGTDEAACTRCDLYQQLAGDYEAAFGVLRVVHPDPTVPRLYIDIEGSRLELIPGANGEFSARYRLFGLIPIDLPALRATRVRFPVDPLSGQHMAGIYAEDVPVSIGSRLPPAADRPGLPAPWRARLGAYRVCNRVPGGARYELMRNIKLIYDRKSRILKLASVVHTTTGSQAMVLPLRWLNDNEAVVYGLGRHQGDTVRAEPAPRPDPETKPAANSASRVISYSGFRLCRAGD